MTLKSLLFGSAAVIAAGTGAQAADLPIAEPVEYVRICDAFGDGFYYLPGTDTCLQVGGQVRVEAHYVDTLDGNGALLRADDPDLNNFTTRARGNARLDARTQTDFALVRAFIDLEMTVGAGADFRGSSGEANYDSTDVSLAAAFVEISNDFGTFTAGHAGSFFDFFGSYAFGTRLDIDDNTTEQTLFAYTFAGSNGISATLSLEDPASNGRRLEGGRGESGDYEGQEAPDGVVRLRIDQGFGSAQIMGVVGQIHDNDLGEEEEDEIGWAVGAGLSTEIPILSGVEFAVQGGYSEGRLGYISTDRGGLGDFTDGPGDDDLETTEGYAVRAGVRAGFTERFDGSVSGSYTHVAHSDDAITEREYDFWAVNANVRFKPVDGLYMGPEVAYQTIERDGYGDNDIDENDVVGVMFRVQRSF